jgi:hypothetical protein
MKHFVFHLPSIDEPIRGNSGATQLQRIYFVYNRLQE